jgi:hypothetical protein
MDDIKRSDDHAMLQLMLESEAISSWEYNALALKIGNGASLHSLLPRACVTTSCPRRGVPPRLRTACHATGRRNFESGRRWRAQRQPCRARMLVPLGHLISRATCPVTSATSQCPRSCWNDTAL